MSNISISTSFNYEIPIELQLDMISLAGFNYVSIGGNYIHSGILDADRLDDLNDAIKGKSLSVDTIHGYNIDKNDAVDVNAAIVKAAQKLHSPVVVLHCSSFTFSPDDVENRKKDVMRKLPLLEKLAKDSGVKFAFENVLPGVATDFMEEILNNANPEYFGFCYDLSHDQVDGPRPFDLLERQCKRLLAVHISDRIKEFIDHVTPGEGFVDFESVCALLKKAEIQFPLLMEVMMTNSKYKNTNEFLAVTKREAEKMYHKIYQ